MSVFTNFLTVYSYNDGTSTASSSGNGMVTLVLAVFIVALAVFMIAAMWKVFVKAGKPGWAAIVPIYNSWTLAEVGGKPGWWGLYPLLSIVPFVGAIAGLVVGIMIAIGVARNFAKSDAFGVIALGLFGFVGYPMLGFGNAQYHAQSGGDGTSGTSGMQPPQAPTQPMPPVNPIS